MPQSLQDGHGKYLIQKYDKRNKSAIIMKCLKYTWHVIKLLKLFKTFKNPEFNDHCNFFMCIPLEKMQALGRVRGLLSG